MATQKTKSGATKTATVKRTITGIFDPVALAGQAAVARVEGEKMLYAVVDYCRQINNGFVKKGGKVGTKASDCAIMGAWRKTLETLGVAEQTVANRCTAFRNACNKGIDYSDNQYRPKAGLKGAQSGDSGERPVVKMTIIKDATTGEVAEGLRSVFNTEKFRAAHGELAAFLIDAITEYEGH